MVDMSLKKWNYLKQELISAWKIVNIAKEENVAAV